jgi:hypothetical protein
VKDLAEPVLDASDGAMTVGYHNYDHEFQTFGRHLRLRHLRRPPERRRTPLVDMASSCVGGANPVALLSRQADKIGSLNMKDAVMIDDDAEPVEIGEGDVNLKAIAHVARGAADVDSLLY